MLIRTFDDPDWAQVRPILRDVVAEQETFAYDPAMTEDEARSMWVVSPPGRTVVGEASGQVLGTANMYANRPGPGKHIASGSFMVGRAARGKGVGRALVEAALLPSVQVPTLGDEDVVRVLAVATAMVGAAITST